MRRGTTNRDERGSAAARRARKLWLLAEFGDGTAAPCSFNCGAVLTFETITIDRYPVPGCRGGRYIRGNIRPACAPCNSVHGGGLRSS
jgi:hypothetical protein